MMFPLLSYYAIYLVFHYMEADLEHIPVCSAVGLSFSSNPALARMCWLHILAQVLALFHGGMAPSWGNSFLKSSWLLFFFSSP
jgi:hypothetical protein